MEQNKTAKGKTCGFCLFPIFPLWSKSAHYVVFSLQDCSQAAAFANLYIWAWLWMGSLEFTAILQWVQRFPRTKPRGPQVQARPPVTQLWLRRRIHHSPALAPPPYSDPASLPILFPQERTKGYPSNQGQTCMQGTCSRTHWWFFT